MDENSLCSLTHTSPNTHTCSNSSHATTDDDDGDLRDGDHGVASATPAENVPTDSSPADEVSMEERIRNEFNISEFLKLATRDVDKGDSESMAALLDLNRRWTKKFGAASTTDGAGVAFAEFAQIRNRPQVPARWIPRLPTPEQAARILQAPASRVSLNAAPPDSQETRVFAADRVFDVSSSMPTLGISRPIQSTTEPRTAIPIVSDGFYAPSPLTHSPQAEPILDLTDSILSASPALMMADLNGQSASSTALDGDKITEAYHKSSHRTLSFVPPSVQNGEVIVRPSIDIVRHGSTRWKTTAVGYFLVYVQKPRAEPLKSTISADPINEHVVDPALAQRGDVPVEPVMPSTAKALSVNHVKCLWNVRGCRNRRDHQTAVRNLVTDSRLYFLGLLETRVTLPNVTRVQSSLMPRWKWFTDYNNPGNRIWLTWNDEFIDVDVVDIRAQFIHCRILIRTMRISILVTVASGDNEIGARRICGRLCVILQIQLGKNRGLWGVISMLFVI
ncbi:hypothetical protein Sango_3092000 [Sesamum angolense]|uniref:Uncharacterized protein n=1 Tax=Sesamum angolense TaxID=2727404 RepID=A0AAE1T9T6_9LAMI|nr:hypothetical protein Sango_3092000 [Sesamum angolense]